MTHLASQFLTWLYEDGQGYMEIVAGRTNPDDPKKISMVMRTRRWCYYDPERPDLRDQATAYIDQLADQYGNVYVGCRLYTREAKDRNERDEERTLPSNVIFIDDAPDEPYLRYSLSVRTSEGSLHAYYKCDRPTTKNDVRRAASFLDGDPSGVDLTQLVRVPGTFNTKHHQRFPVVIEDTGPTYRLEELRTKFPEVAPEQRKDSGAVVEALNWPEVETHLANIKALLACARTQLIKPETQTGRILAGELLTIGDGSRSMNKYVAMYGLYLRGFADDEIAAVGIHLDRQWGVERDKGTAWCKLDTARILAKCHAKMPDVRQSPTRYRKGTPTEPIAEVRPISRARSDRPQCFTPAALFLAYQQRLDLCEMKRKARAAALGISTATLDRLEGSLKQDGLIAVETDPHRQGSRVILVGVINIPTSEVLSAAPTAEADELPSIGAGSRQTAIEPPQCIGETRPPPNTPAGVSPQPTPVAPPTLAAAVGEALASLPRERTNRTTGEIKRWPRSCGRIIGWIETHYPSLNFTDAQLDTAIEDGHRAERLADLATMKPGTLKAEIRAAERRAERDRELGGNAWRWWSFFADMAKRELKSRPPDPKRPKGGYKPCEAKPNPRDVAAALQAEMWGIVEEERVRHPLTAPIARAAKVVEPAYQNIDTAPMFARLKEAAHV